MTDSQPRTRTGGWGPFALPWERTWRKQADARATADLLRAYGSVDEAGEPKPLSWHEPTVESRARQANNSNVTVDPAMDLVPDGATLLARAQERADAIIADAESEARARKDSARSVAGALQQDAERRHKEVMGALEEKRLTLARKIEELRTFEREYRSRLRHYVSSHLEELESRGISESDEWVRDVEVRHKELKSFFEASLRDLDARGTRRDRRDRDPDISPTL
jgi:vacuolar-type H+-ATPase subunit H